ncbi:MAG: iron-containing alcohol dehydrogenase [Clostridia bacterium]|nr:iron-containing alcohol dehydrogenase [Clostridia bacterium]
MPSEYSQLCPVLFGEGAAGQLPEKIQQFGGGPVLFICDPGIRGTGLVDRMADAVRAAGLEADVYDEVEADAPDTVIDRCSVVLSRKQYHVLVGVGGGSSLDSAKAIAVLAENPGPVSKYYMTWQAGREVKLILIPTTSGTGSEVTPMCVIHDTVNNIKTGILRPADYAIVDPALTVSCPPKITAYTGMDALSHAVEAYTCTSRNEHSDLLALECARLVVKNLKAACADGTDMAARSALSFASNIAGIAFGESSVHAGHAIAHETGVVLELPHGLLCALVTPAVLEYSAPCYPERMVPLAEALGATDVTPDNAGVKAAEAVRALRRGLGIPTLKELSVRREDAVACAQGAFDHNIFIVTAPKPTGVPELAELIGKMYDEE